MFFFEIYSGALGEYSKITIMITNLEAFINFTMFYVLILTSLMTTKNQELLVIELDHIEKLFLNLELNRENKQKIKKFHIRSRKESMKIFIIIFSLYFLMFIFGYEYQFYLMNLPVLQFVLISIENFDYLFLGVYSTILLTFFYYFLMNLSEFTRIISSLKVNENLETIELIFRMRKLTFDFLDEFGFFTTFYNVYCSINISFQFYYIYIGLFYNYNFNLFSTLNMFWYLPMLYILHRLGSLCTQLNNDFENSSKIILKSQTMKDKIFMSLLDEDNEFFESNGFLTLSGSTSIKVIFLIEFHKTF